MGSSKTTCPGCGSTNVEQYCANCGERRWEAHDYSVKRFLTATFADVTSVDAKLYHTLRILVRKPGELTREFMQGRRARYMQPLQLFLIANLVYFVVQPFTGYSGYNTPLQSQISDQFYSQAAGLAQVAKAHAAAHHMSLQAFADVYNAKSEIYAKSLVLLMVPLFGLIVALLHINKRRPLIEHLVFTMHYFAFELLFVDAIFLLLYVKLLLPVLVSVMTATGVRHTAIGGILWFVLTELPTALVLIPYLIFAFRRVYGDSRVGAIGRGVACVPGLLLVMITYRFLLFWITIVSI